MQDRGSGSHSEAAGAGPSARAVALGCIRAFTLGCPVRSRGVGAELLSGRFSVGASAKDRQLALWFLNTVHVYHASLTRTRTCTHTETHTHMECRPTLECRSKDSLGRHPSEQRNPTHPHWMDSTQSASLCLGHRPEGIRGARNPAGLSSQSGGSQGSSEFPVEQCHAFERH